jgi:hypothetical protein
LQLLEVRRGNTKALTLLLVSSLPLGRRSIEIGVERKDGAVSCEINKKPLNSENLLPMGRALAHTASR